MDLSNISNLRTALALAGVKPNKALGQHFLVDRPSLEQIVAAANIKPADTVLEIGPGLGVMTALLSAQAGRVVAVEADPALAELLQRQKLPKLEVVNDDIRIFDFRQLPADYKVAANLPYYLTSPILRLLLESPNPPAVMSVLIQKEVAERVTAEPGQLSILALSVQYYDEAEIVGYVERHKFWPAPQVDSAILKITRRARPAFAADPTKLFRLIKAGFGEKRKQLRNSLAGGLNTSVERTAELLKQSKLGPHARAQELSLPEWQRLYEQALAAKLLN